MALDLSEYESILSNPDATVEGLNNALNDLSSDEGKISFDREDLKRRFEEKIKSMTTSEAPASEPIKPQNTDGEDKIVVNDGSSRLDEMFSNNERREFVGNEFRNGEFSSQAHVDFYIEQLAEGNLVFPDEKSLGKLKNLLDDQVKKAQPQETIAKKILNDFAVDRRINSMAPTGAAPTTINDFGLTDALDRYQKGKSKDSADYMLREAQKAAIANRFTGYEDGKNPYAGFIDNLKEEKDKTSKWKFNRRRKLEKARRDIDPAAYYGEKELNGSWLGRKTGYYKLRKKIVDYKGKSFDRIAIRLDKVLDLKSENASYKWLSKNAFKKLGTNAKLAYYQTLYLGSSEKLTNRLMDHANITKLQSYSRGLSEKINKAQNEYISDRPTADARAMYQNMLKQIQQSCQNRENSLAEQKKEMIGSLGNDDIENATKNFDSFTVNLDNRVALLKQRYNEECAKNPLLRVLQTVETQMPDKNASQVPDTDDPQMSDNQIHNREIITHEAVLQQVAKELGFPNIDNLLKSRGISDGEIESIKEKLLPKNREGTKENSEEELKDTPANEQKAVNEQTPVNEVQANVGNEVPDYNNEDNAQPDIRQTYPNGDKMDLYIAEDKSRYDLVTQDQNGETREPTAEEISALVEQLGKDGITEVNLENGFSEKTQQAFLAELNKQKIAVANREEVENRLKDAEKLNTENNASEKEQPNGRTEEEKPNAAKNENTPNAAEDKKSEERKDADSNRKENENRLKDTEKLNIENKASEKEQSNGRPEEGKPNPAKDKENEEKNIQKVMIRAVTDSKDEAEQLAKLKVIEKVQSGEFDKSGEGYLNFTKEIVNTFGEKNSDTITLLEISAAKALQDDARKEAKEAKQTQQDKSQKAENDRYIEKTLKDENIELANANSKSSLKVSGIINLANKYKDKGAEELRKDDTYKLLPKYAKQGAENLFHLEHADNLKPEQKQLLRGQILGRVIDQKHQSKRVTHQLQPQQVRQQPNSKQDNNGR